MTVGRTDGLKARIAELEEAVQNLVAVFDDLEDKTGRRPGYWIDRSRIDALRKVLDHE